MIKDLVSDKSFDFILQFEAKPTGNKAIQYTNREKKCYGHTDMVIFNTLRTGVRYIRTLISA